MIQPRLDEDSHYNQHLGELSIFQNESPKECPRLGKDPELIPRDIHRIFCFANWDAQQRHHSRLAFVAWKAMQYALALATKFLTTPEAHGWWHRVLYGDYVEDTTTGRVILQYDPRQYACRDFQADFSDLLDRLARLTTWYWQPSDTWLPGAGVIEAMHGSSLAAVMEAHAPMYLDPELSYTSAERATMHAYHNYIGISTHVLDLLLNPRPLCACENLRIQTYVCNLLLHELAHAVHSISQTQEENFLYPDDKEPEAGFSLERWMWGGKLGLVIGVDEHEREALVLGLLTDDGVWSGLRTKDIEMWWLGKEWEKKGKLLAWASVRHRSWVTQGGICLWRGKGKGLAK